MANDETLDSRSRGDDRLFERKKPDSHGDWLHRWLDEDDVYFEMQNGEVIVVLTEPADKTHPPWALKVTVSLKQFMMNHAEWFRDVLKDEEKWRKE